MCRKTSSRGLGTVEALMSVMGDMQALVMELKNLVEQCLASERTEQVSGKKIENFAPFYPEQWRTHPEPRHVRCAWSFSLRRSYKVTKAQRIHQMT